jgi:hypothetical protein
MYDDDEHDVSGPEEYYAVDFDAADEAYEMYLDAMKACGREEEM